MGDLKAFMQPPVTDKTEEVIISNRFKGSDGKVEPFVIRVISAEIASKLRNQSSRPVRRNGVVVSQELDNDKYTRGLIVACTVTPNFKSSELCDYYKTKDPLDVPERMLTAGEFGKLLRAVNRLNEFGINDDQAKELEEEAKN